MLAPDEILLRCNQIVEEARLITPSLPAFNAVSNFLEGARLVADIVKCWPAERRELAVWLGEFAIGLKKLEGNFNREVERDPGILYKPAHEVSLAFHSSNAFVRYFRAGNRTSKTQSGFIEHRYVTTGTHPYRQFLKPPASTFIIGVNFSKYAPKVFEAKLVMGESGNPLSPLFPENGKWLYKYDERKHIIYVACVTCANKGTAQSCTHAKSTITLFSDTEGPNVLQGGQYNLGHFDEHIREDFFSESIQRLQTVPMSSLMLTGTPLLGKGSWEHQKLTRRFLGGPRVNKVDGSDRPYVSIHSIDQYRAGLFPFEQIETSKIGMDPFEIESRIYGRPASLAKHSVFDRYVLHEMDSCVRQSTQYRLKADATIAKDLDGFLSIWDEPTARGQYIIGCDVAAGLTDGDYSCASVLSLPKFEMVAQYHGHMNPLDYAVDLARLGKFYSNAMLVVERTGGLGVGTITKLKEIGYWNLFRELTDTSQVQFAQDAAYGVDTNMRTKAHMVSCLQQVIKERQIKIPCAQTIEELLAFGQEITPMGLSVRLRGESGTHDDRVMSLVIAVYVAVTYPVYDFRNEISRVVEKATENSEKWADIHRELERRERERKELW